MSNERLASATEVFPWMISRTRADFRLAVQRLNSSYITVLMSCSLKDYGLSRNSPGQYSQMFDKLACHNFG